MLMLLENLATNEQLLSILLRVKQEPLRRSEVRMNCNEKQD